MIEVNILKKYIHMVLIVGILAFSCLGCYLKPENIDVISPVSNSKVRLKIMTTNNLMYNMVKEIVGDRHDVDFMFKYENDQWNFNYTDDSINNISKQDIFIYSGAQYEPWIDDFIGKMNKDKVTIVNASRGTKVYSRDSELEYVNNNKTFVIKDNPYYWMDLDKCKTALFNITKAIEVKDPVNKKIYEDNFQKCVKNIDVKAKDLKNLSKQFKNYVFVVQGDELDYFTKYYGLKTVKIPEIIKENQSQSDIDKMLKEKLSSSNNIVFLCDDDSQIKINEYIIKKYNMGSVCISTYDYGKKYIDILSKDYNNLKKLLPQT